MNTVNIDEIHNDSFDFILFLFLELNNYTNEKKQCTIDYLQKIVFLPSALALDRQSASHSIFLNVVEAGR